MDEVRIQIESLDRFFADAVGMARRLDRGDFTPEPAAFSFERMESLLKVLTPNRWVLLRTLRRRGAGSIRALAQSLNRDYRGVHADVAALIEAGLIEKLENGRITVPWSRIIAEMAVDVAA